MSPLLTTIQLHHYGAPLDFPMRRHAIALTLILVCFRSIRFKLSNNQAKLSKQFITADTAIRIVLLTLQGCTTTHTYHHLPPFACHRSRGDSEDAATTLHPQLRSNPESRLSEGDPYGSLAEVPVQPQMMCAGSQAGLENPFIHLADRATTLPELASYCDLWGSIRGEVLGREGSVSPMCGCTLLLGSPHKNSGLWKCSTRQPTVYSYTASHRSPCIRVDSPTQFHLHQHDCHSDSHNNIIFVSL